eukprot:5310861-Amphidinium_carterae.1
MAQRPKCALQHVPSCKPDRADGARPMELILSPQTPRKMPWTSMPAAASANNLSGDPVLEPKLIRNLCSFTSFIHSFTAVLNVSDAALAKVQVHTRGRRRRVSQS